MTGSSDLVRSWRVLVEETDRHDHAVFVNPDWKALSITGRETIPVFRIDGRLLPLETAVTSDIGKVMSAAQANGVTIKQIEIDYDCATSQLAAYAGFLANLRKTIPPDLRISITATPTWLSSAQFGPLTKQADEIVLQVHAVRNPGQGLFDPAMAEGWVRQAAGRTNKPLWVAVPTYGSKVSRTSDGRILMVESEDQTLTGGLSGQELVVAPTAVYRLTRALGQRPPATLEGIVWFRLPTDDDARAWSVETWRSVLTGDVHEVRLQARTEEADTPGLKSILLINPDALDTPLPDFITSLQTCSLGDGANGYEMTQLQTGFRLQRTQDGLLHGHSSRIIGWVRCNDERLSLNVEP
jgi:hypothetical protein